MQQLPKLHWNYSYGAIIWGSVHPTEENIFLLNNIDMYNYTAVPLRRVQKSKSHFWFLNTFGGGGGLWGQY